MAKQDELDAVLQRVRARGTIVAVERNLKKARYRRESLSDEEIKSMLEQKAYYLGRQVPGDSNPFDDWDHPGADRLAKSYRIGRG